MNPLILWKLKKYCTKHQLDSEHIDQSLSYEENMEYLRELTRDFGPDIDRFLPELDQYLEDQRKTFLKRYIYATKIGETKTVDVGSPIEPTGGFSLAAYIQSFLG